MQTSQKLKITTPANENQAAFGRKHTKTRDTQYEHRVSEIYQKYT